MKGKFPYIPITNKSTVCRIKKPVCFLTYRLFWGCLPGAVQTQTDGRRVVVRTERIICPAVSRKLIGEAVAAAQLNPSQRFVVKRVYFAQTGDIDFVAVDNRLHDTRFDINVSIAFVKTECFRQLNARFQFNLLKVVIFRLLADAVGRVVIVDLRIEYAQARC